MLRRRVLAAAFGVFVATFPGGAAGPTVMSEVASLAGILARAIAVDAAGNMYVAGSALSTFVATPGAFKTRCESSCSDGAIVKLSPQGQVLFASYFGGSRDDSVRGMALDDAGAIYLVGSTGSSDFPVRNPLTSETSTHESYIAKFSTEGQLLFSSRLGGVAATAVAIAPGGDILIAGVALQHTVPMVKALQPLPKYGEGDAFVARLRGDGSAIVFSSYLGGSGSDNPVAIASAADGGLVVVGYTTSVDFPSVRDDRPAPAPPPAPISYNGFVTAYSPDGSFMAFSRTLGGQRSDRATSVAVTPGGRVLVAGITESFDLPVTEDALDADCGTDARCNEAWSSFHGYPFIGYRSDGFLMAFDPDGRRVFSSYFGGSGSDAGTGLATMPDGTVYLSAISDSADVAGTAACESRLCPIVLYELSPRNLRLIADTRQPTPALFEPNLESAPMSVTTSGTVVMLAIAWPRATVLRGERR